MKKLIASLLGLFITAPAIAAAPHTTADSHSSAATSQAKVSSPVKNSVVTTASGLRYTDSVIGSGASAIPGKSVSVHYTGWILEGGDKKGAKFDSSVDRGTPFTFPLGAGRVIAGWDEGVAGMKEGGKRTLMIPSKLGYGAQAVGPIPANSNLVFDVELIKVN